MNIGGVQRARPCAAIDGIPPAGGGSTARGPLDNAPAVGRKPALSTAALDARLDELKAIILVRDFRNATPEDIAIVREWAGLAVEAQRRVWPGRAS